MVVAHLAHGSRQLPVDFGREPIHNQLEVNPPTPGPYRGAAPRAANLGSRTAAIGSPSRLRVTASMTPAIPSTAPAVATALKKGPGRIRRADSNRAVDLLN